MDTFNYLQSVDHGQLHFADGAVTAIPHWEDPSWAHLFLVRHADKAKDEGPIDPGLSAEGEARAERLGRIFSASGLDTVFATPTKRAQKTAEPVQRRAHTPSVETYNPDEQASWLHENLPLWMGKKILIVGHQYTVPHLLNQLKGRGFDFDNIPNADYGQVYIVATKGIGETEILALRY